MAAKQKQKKKQKSSFVSVEGAEFFKVFLPSFNSHQLMIPPDFSKELRKTMKDKVILKNEDGKTWYVDVKDAPDGDGVFLKDGWQSFVDYHALKLGEFLVFHYGGSFSFLVKIYGINGCKKETLKSKTIVTHVKSQEESDEETKPKRPSRKHKRPHNEDHFDRKRFRQVIEAQEDVGASQQPQESKEFENTALVAHKSPSFIASPIPSIFCKLKVPKEVMKSGNVPLKAQMILCNAKGKEWPVRINTPRYGPTCLGKGLFAFQTDNNIGPNDTCEFTFATQTTINVKVLHNSKKSLNS